MAYPETPQPPNTPAHAEVSAVAINFDYHNIKKAAIILRALNNKLRQQVIAKIHMNIRLTVTQLYVGLGLEQSVASQHLAILRKAGIVSTERDGKFIFYKINSSRIKGIVTSVKKLV